MSFPAFFTLILVSIATPLPLLATTCKKVVDPQVTTLTLDPDLNLAGPLGLLLPAQLSDFSHPSAARTLVFLAERKIFISQMDPTLLQNGISLPPPAGICGPICGANIFMTMANYKQIPPPSGNPYDVIQYFVNEYSRIFGVDARKNTDPDRLSQLIVGAQLAHRMKYQAMGPISSGVRLAELINSQPSALGLAQVAFTGQRDRHWILILKVDQDQRRIIISDPNRPNSVFSSPYLEANGVLSFQLFGNYVGQNIAHINNLILFTSD